MASVATEDHSWSSNLERIHIRENVQLRSYKNFHFKVGSLWFGGWMSLYHSSYLQIIISTYGIKGEVVLSPVYDASMNKRKIWWGDLVCSINNWIQGKKVEVIYFYHSFLCICHLNANSVVHMIFNIIYLSITLSSKLSSFSMDLQIFISLYSLFVKGWDKWSWYVVTHT